MYICPLPASVFPVYYLLRMMLTKLWTVFVTRSVILHWQVGTQPSLLCPMLGEGLSCENSGPNPISCCCYTRIVSAILELIHLQGLSKAASQS